MDRVCSHAFFCALPRSSLLALITVASLVCSVAPVSAAEDRESKRDSAAVGTLEDLYGDTGNSFQGAIGFVAFEADTSPAAVSGYGLGIDDMVVEWREFSLQKDTTNCATSCVGGTNPGAPCGDDTDCPGGGACAGGVCATVGLKTVNVFRGSAVLEITVTDNTPYGVDGVNDCDDNDLFTDPGDDTDCNDNGTTDVIVKATSEGEIAGELVALDLVSSGIYFGTLPTSAIYDVPGVLFLQQQGADLPTATITYDDLDDGTGAVCQNDVNPAARGRVQAATSIFLTLGNVVVRDTEISDNGDDDGFGDDHETVQMLIELSNTGTVNLGGVVARLSTDDPRVDCISDSIIDMGPLAAGESRFSIDAFEFKLGSVGRIDASEELGIDFTVHISTDEFDAIVAPQTVSLEPDLDVTGGSGPTTFLESFDVTSGFGSFTEMHIDLGLTGSNAASDGYRCQYHDPDWINSNSYGTGSGQDCYLNPTDAPEAFFWQTLTDRSFSGTHSLYFGIPLAGDQFTTPLAQLEAVASSDPINLGYNVCSSTSQTCSNDSDCPMGETCDTVSPMLRFKHQASFVDGRGGCNGACDKGVVFIQLADANGDPQGDWIKVTPQVNVYDIQPVQGLTNCTFDPIDDGNTEDDFFDPTDPDRRLGPASACFPEFVFAYVGDTDSAFQVDNIGRASDGPGLEGATGLGTWVESSSDLGPFRGRRVRVRFLSTGIKAGTGEDHESLFDWNPTPVDDGWFIDDVEVSHTLMSPAMVVADTTDNSSLPGCASCGSVSADLSIVDDPPLSTLPAPGLVVTLSAANSTVDTCPDGVLQQRFSINGTPVGPFSDHPVFIDAPQQETTYGVDVRCSSDTACSDSTSRIIDVLCPGFYNNTLLPSADGSTFGWTSGSVNISFVRGDLATLDAGYSFSFNADIDATSSIPSSGTVASSGDGLWYLAAKNANLSSGFCNSATWGRTTRDGALGDPLALP